MSLLLSTLLLSNDAHAVRPAMDPQIRVHAGASNFTGPSSWGFTFGADSRLTRLAYVDAGAVVTPAIIPTDFVVESDDDADYFFMRHSIYITPGLRVPHRQPQGFSWDLTFRGGVGVVWTADMHDDNVVVYHERAPYNVELDPAVIAGADLLVRKGYIGIRGSAKAYGTQIIYASSFDELLIWSPQFGIEGVYQF